MNPNTTERRHPYLMNPEGNPLLPSGVVHDRRRREVVEDLLEAMRARARSARMEGQEPEPTVLRRSARRAFWFVMAVLLLAAILITLIARSSDHPIPLRDQPLGAGAVYGWIGFHRSATTIP